MSDKLLVETPSPYIRHLIINRPERHNALDRETYTALSEALAVADADETIHVIVLSGQGGCFTSGNDLKDFTTEGHLDQTGKSPGLNFLLQLHHMQKPVIAAVEKYAIGIGTTLLNHCDLVYASETAKFRVPFTALGLSPEGGSTYYFPKMAGPKKANELLLFGDFFTAQQALDYHFVNEITPEGQTVSVALDKAKLLAALPLHSILATKKMLKQNTAQLVEDIMENEAKTFHHIRELPETQKILSSFFNKK